MASEYAATIFTEQRESSAEQPDTSLVDEQFVTSTKATSEQDADSDEENPSGDTGDNSNISDNGGRVKIGAEAGLAGICYDFERSKITHARIASLENSTRYFPIGFAQPAGIDSVPNPKENEVVVFEDFFTAGLRIPPHPIFWEILHKF
jgi:hypothetical protein